ncbi:MAG: hypothetical protein COB15_05820 [Flavobacteriales bacterium]|nr:MAG: hypothetical protein COB15_05820 [Flavobacteriales bacterium]
MQEDEIDLIKLVKQLKKTSLYLRIKHEFSFVFRNKIWFILFLIIGAALGYYKTSKNIPIYRSEMTVKSNILDNPSNEHLISSLLTLIQDGNAEELAKIGLSEEDFIHIKNIDFIYPYKEDDKNQTFDSLRRLEPFRIAVYSTSNKEFSNSEKFILNYLENNEYSANVKKNNIKVLKQKKIDLISKINALDSMQIKINSFLKTNNDNSLTTVFDPSILIKEKTIAKMELIEIQKEFDQINNYQVLRSMVPRLRPEYHHDKSMMKFSFLFLIIGGILLRLIKKK